MSIVAIKVVIISAVPSAYFYLFYHTSTSYLSYLVHLAVIQGPVHFYGLFKQGLQA